MKYFFILMAVCVLAACNNQNNDAGQGLAKEAVTTGSGPGLQHAQRYIDSIYMLTRRGASGEINMNQVEAQVNKFKDSVRIAMSGFSESDSVNIKKYEDKKLEETMKWMSENGY